MAYLVDAWQSKTTATVNVSLVDTLDGMDPNPEIT
jgi:hypothetical protein